MRTAPGDHQPPTTNCHQPPPTATNRQLPTAANRQRRPTYQPTTANHQPPTTNHQSPTANRPPPIATNCQPLMATNHHEHMSYTRSLCKTAVPEHFFFLLRTGLATEQCLQGPKLRRTCPRTWRVPSAIPSATSIRQRSGLGPRLPLSCCSIQPPRFPPVTRHRYWTSTTSWCRRVGTSPRC